MEKRRPGRPVGRSTFVTSCLPPHANVFNTPQQVTREIAELAGSNLAMIHYYFWQQGRPEGGAGGCNEAPMSKPGTTAATT